MFKGGRYLYVAFMCQQAIEKTLKGYPSQGNKANASLHAQFTTTCGGAEFFEKLSQEQIGLLDKFNAYYIESRYAETLAEMQSAIDQKDAGRILKECKEMLQWLEAYKK